MLGVFTSVGALVFGMALAWLLKGQRRGISARSSKRPGHIVLIGMLIAMIVLTGCSNASSSQTASPTPVPSPTATPSPGVTPSPTTAATSTPTTAPAGSGDWTTYHLNNARTGYIPGVPDPQQLTRAWRMPLDGAVYAEPLVVHGHVIVVTEGDSLYSLNASTGAIQWRTNVGTPVPRSTLPCGDIDPLGITGTPVYDPNTGLIFAVAEVSGSAHILVGVDVNTGQVKVRRSVDLNGMDPRAHQQRGALALSQDMVYITFGGLAGDCSDYIGRVVASRTDGQGQLLSYTVPTPREGGIWAPSGPAVDAAGNVYVAVGNGEVTSGNWDHSDSILRLSPTLQLEDAFAPSQWAAENSTDTDLGSVGPMLLSNGLVFGAGKSGLGYLLHANNLGGVGGQALETRVCNGGTFGGAAFDGTNVFAPCANGVQQLTLGPGATLTKGWHASGALTSPIVAGHTLYCLDPGGILYAYNIDTGDVRAKIGIDTASRFATPTLVGHTVFVGTFGGVTAITLS